MASAKKNRDFAMLMSEGNRACLYLLHILLWTWQSVNGSEAVQSDIECLRGVKAELKDSDNYLSSWDFSNNTEGFVCHFNGIECWKADESKVLNIRLSNMGLRGQFPSALRNCTSLTGLDLSANELSGILPHDIGSIIPYITALDLSSNNFTGEIPANLANCSYLNLLRLQHNHFSGQIPWQLSWLSRLSVFNVADNALSGQIPYFSWRLPESSFSNNSDLCGEPLVVCSGHSKQSHGGTMLAIMAVGAVLLI